ncbi:hypothetical protein P168DRAFT_316332 [Aspergillus campestris IBT 28561]|uniref:Uncharacterized protein n=1 Tax=Aspergillus campestris (strain IBT 28561) TaxID=1392248 RepID=A0A2I1D8Y6_ASPC2|nr:uncharacterized protein P168DRAFT_316332 [Aspergillus campestris IBT 28561]PKY06318.1 hypothetical protein P168DRAFT_316332 [Aspergillus campestris IBT 28561]
MATEQTGLNVLRQRSIVDCDTMDEDGARSFGPFDDCTSNQAIAYAELSKPKHTGLIAAAVIHAGRLLQEFPGIGLRELAVEVAMVKLALKIAPYVTGHVHIQTNPYYVYSTENTISYAQREQLP